jgi:diketogulonate reductase-like aldo/keto reductase
VRSIGVSNFNARQLEAIIEDTGVPPSVNQLESHPFLANEKLRQFCAERGVRMTAYCPLARVGRSGEESPLAHPLIRSLAAKHATTSAAVCLRWQTQRGVLVIPKSDSRQRMAENLRILDFELSADEMAAILGLDRGLRLVRHDKHGVSAHREWPFADPF